MSCTCMGVSPYQKLQICAYEASILLENTSKTLVLQTSFHESLVEWLWLNGVTFDVPDIV